MVASLILLSACDPVTSPSTTLSTVPVGAETTTTLTASPSSSTATASTGDRALGEVDLDAAEPYSGKDCARDQVLLSDPAGTVWVLDLDELAAYRLAHFKKDGDSPVQAFGYETFLVAGDEGLVLVWGGERAVLVDPPVGEDVAFVPYVRVLDTSCHDDGSLLSVLLAGEFDSWFVDFYGLALVNADGLVSFQPLNLSFEADFAEFSPTGAFATLALFGPDPAFGGLWGVLDVASGAEVVIPEDVPMVPIGGEPTLFVGPMTWTDDATVRQHWKVGDADIKAVDINLTDGTFVSVEPDSVRGWSGECPTRVFGGFVRDEVRGPLALIDETVVSYCW